MRVLRRCFWVLCFLGLVMPFNIQGQVAETNVNKIIIYPRKGQSTSELKRLGIKNVDDYGSYWLVRASKEQSKELSKTFGDQAVKADYLNQIELNATRLDTTVGEPAIPDGLKQVETGGKRLRLIQFKGPVKPQWLDQVKAAGPLKIVNYVPNNAYMVWLDADTEKQIGGLLYPQGPIQWIGPYHPQYKVQRGLLAAEPGKAQETISVQVGVIEDAGSSETANRIQALGAVQGSYDSAGVKVFTLDVPRSTISEIAQWPDVLWVSRTAPKRLFDEVQDLVVATYTNEPTAHGPLPPPSGPRYLDFLTSKVGGGLTEFFDPSTYPIVDIADTGMTASAPYYYYAELSLTSTYVVPAAPYPIHPSFYYLGVPDFYFYGPQSSVGIPLFIPRGLSRVAYEQPPFFTYGAGTENNDFLGCTRVNTVFFGPEDFNGHGTIVASIVSGYDTSPDFIFQCEILSPPTLTVVDTNITCSGVSTTITWGAEHQVVPPTNVTYDLTGCSGSVTDILQAVFTSTFITTTAAEQHQDSYGFQLGMGVSPFGQIGVSRIFSQVATASRPAGGACGVNITTPTFCVNSLPSLVSYAYASGARIQNNSWGDVLLATGANAGQYNAESLAYDTAVRDAVPSGTGGTSPFTLNQEFIAVFAGGDNGTVGTAGGFSDMRVTAPATAKNIIAVGASQNAHQELEFIGENSFAMDNWSSPGPTVDGRFKPEIVAPGWIIYGANGGPNAFVGVVNTTACNTVMATNEGAGFIQRCVDPDTGTNKFVVNSLYTMTSGSSAFNNFGSSYAAPAVSGAIQLLWWYFEHRLTDELGIRRLQPSPAMAKAYVVNSARYLPITSLQTGTNDTLPSIIQGMGELDLRRMFDGVPRLIRDESTPRAVDTPQITVGPAQQTYFSQSGQSYELAGQVASNGQPFRVTLAWTDAPGNPAAFQQLVNNLDLEVTIGGQLYKGNVFNGDHSVPGGSHDSLNNLESVFLPAGGPVMSGAPYSVVVRAANIAGDGVPNVGGTLGQDFALVVYNSQNPSDVPNLSTNNSCATAIVISNNPFSFVNTLTTNVYSNVQPSPTAGRGGVDEFFKLTNPTPGSLFTIDTSGSSFSTVLSVWRVRVIPQVIFPGGGECGALTEVVSSSGTVAPSSVSFTADGSNDYFIVVEPSDDGPGGLMVLNVSATGPAISVTPSSLYFPDEMSGLTSAVQVVTYQNNLTNPPVSVAISTVSITGSNADEFVIESRSCAGNVLAPGQQCSVSIAFAPTNTGIRVAQLVINDNATGSPRLVPLIGNALPAAPLVCASPSSLIFSNQLVGSNIVQAVTVTNCGSAALVIDNVTLTGSASADFTTNGISCTPFPATVQPGQLCTINVSFTASTNGARNAMLSFFDNAFGSPQQVPVLGIGCTPITVTPTTLPDTTTGSAYTQSLSAVGGVPLYFFTVTRGRLPPGVTLLGSGVFTGSPTALGSYTFTVTATDANGCSGSQQYTIHVTCPVLGLTPLTVSNALVGVSFSQTITVSNGVSPVTFTPTGGSLPPGLTLTTSGAITGTPASVGTYPFTVTATDSNSCVGSRSYAISVTCPPIQLFTTSLPGGVLGVPPSLPSGTNGWSYGVAVTGAGLVTNSIITATGGTPPYSFAVTRGLLPPGLSLVGLATNAVTGAATSTVSSAISTAVLGIPTQTGSFTFTVTATDSNHCTGAASMVLNVEASATFVTFSPSAVSFGEQPVGTTSLVQTVTLHNGAPVALNVFGVGFTGANPSDFALVSQNCAGNPIPPGNDCTINIQFAPTSTGLRTAQLTVTDDATGSPHIAPLSGNGLPPASIVCLNPGSLSFGVVAVESTSAVQTVTISNCGSAPLFTTNIVISGSGAGNYIVSSDTCSGSTLPPGGTCTISVAFAPKVSGPSSAVLTINDNALNGPNVVTLTGNGQGSEPDLWINKNRNVKKFIGKGVRTPPNPIRVQTLTQKGRRGRKRVFFVVVQNASTSPDSLLVHGDSGVPGLFGVKYFLGAVPSESTDVTAAVESGTFSTATMGGGAFTGVSSMLRVEITPDPKAPATISTVTITARSSADPTKTDSVEAVVTVK